MTIYGDLFYKSQVSGSYNSASIVLPILLNALNVKSLVDVGCGRGLWLKAAEFYGVERLVGFDGPWNEGKIASSKAVFYPVNLNEGISISEHFDLALSLEVAEHCSPESSETFISNLCLLSDVVFFGAAIPKQGGLDHRNERWQSEWANIFKSHDYVAFDFVREKVWSNPNVEFWYQQNPVLYVKRASKAFEHLVSQGLSATANHKYLDKVHPTLYQLKIYPNSVRASLNAITLGFYTLACNLPNFLKRITRIR